MNTMLPISDNQEIPLYRALPAARPGFVFGAIKNFVVYSPVVDKKKKLFVAVEFSSDALKFCIRHHSRLKNT